METNEGIFTSCDDDNKYEVLEFVYGVDMDSDEETNANIDDKVQNKKVRVDAFLAENIEHLSRSRIKAFLDEGLLLINDKVVRQGSCKLSVGDKIILKVPLFSEEAMPEPEDIPIEIIYEDDDLIVINKKVGLVVHPGSGNHSGTLVNALLHHCKDSLSGIGGVKRPGIVHRLDKDTSGLMVVAKNDKAHQHLTEQFAKRTLYRSYDALVWGIVEPEEGEIEGNIARHKKNRQKMCVVEGSGKEALTHYETIDHYLHMITHVRCTLHSGRTHQIRVHFSHIGYPLLGDNTYGNVPRAYRLNRTKPILDYLRENPGQLLHASRLHFIHPSTNKKMRFESPLPQKFQDLFELFKS